MPARFSMTPTAAAVACALWTTAPLAQTQAVSDVQFHLDFTGRPLTNLAYERLTIDNGTRGFMQGAGTGIPPSVHVDARAYAGALDLLWMDSFYMLQFDALDAGRRTLSVDIWAQVAQAGSGVRTARGDLSIARGQVQWSAAASSPHGSVSPGTRAQSFASGWGDVFAQHAPLRFTFDPAMSGLGQYSVTLTSRALVQRITSPVPEPQTYALMAIGLVGIGCAVRRGQPAHAVPR